MRSIASPAQTGPSGAHRPTYWRGSWPAFLFFVTTDTGAVVADVAPYFGHPEIDLALVDYFHPVPDDDEPGYG
jgi:fructosamine-3-kinase